MKRIARAIAPIACVIGLAASTACGAEDAQSSDVSSPQHGKACKVGGSQCRWDGQCCSGRCYVDTGCNG